MPVELIKLSIKDRLNRDKGKRGKIRRTRDQVIFTNEEKGKSGKSFLLRENLKVNRKRLHINVSTAT